MDAETADWIEKTYGSFRWWKRWKGSRPGAVAAYLRRTPRLLIYSRHINGRWVTTRRIRAYYCKSEDMFHPAQIGWEHSRGRGPTASGGRGMIPRTHNTFSSHLQPQLL